jgi:NADPH:quinone reductase-like Zn-dependent oxidoreductase
MGSACAGVEVGDAVYGLNDWFLDGAQAEYCLTVAASIAPKPHTLDHVQAAAVPISALTAWQALIDRAHLSAGQRVLIHGAAGGVGTFAVQLARRQRAHVIATASAANSDFVKALGADEVIDYQIRGLKRSRETWTWCLIQSEETRETVRGEFSERVVGW